MDKNNLIQSLNWRYATKHFDAKRKISEEDLSILKKSLTLSPSSFGLQPYKFIIIENQEIKEKLKPFAFNQQQISDCSHLVVFCAKKEINNKDIKDFIELTSKQREIPLSDLENYKKMIEGFVNHSSKDFIENWNKRQAYLALGFLLSSASILKIDSCPMEGFSPEKFNETLNIEKEYSSVVLCTLGYRSENDKYANAKKVRKTENQIFKTI